MKKRRRNHTGRRKIIHGVMLLGINDIAGYDVIENPKMALALKNKFCKGLDDYLAERSVAMKKAIIRYVIKDCENEIAKAELNESHVAQLRLIQEYLLILQEQICSK